MNSRTKKYKKTQLYLNRISQIFYTEKVNIHNSFISKCPYSSSVFHTQKIGFKNLIFSILKIIYFNIIFNVKFFIYCVNMFLYKMFTSKKVILSENLIDIYLSNNIRDGNNLFIDKYLTGISQEIIESNSTYSYLIKNNLITFDFFKTVGIFKSTSNLHDKVFFSYDLIGLNGLIYIYLDYLLYTCNTIRYLIYFLSKKKHYLFFGFLSSLNNSLIDSFIRKQVGKKVASFDKLKYVLSWCEYKNYDKSFYSSVRNESNKLIFGFQCFIPFECWLNINISNFDKKINCAPDKLFLNGPINYDIQDYKNSFLSKPYRYTNILSRQKNYTFPNSTYKILFLLPFMKNDLISLCHLANMVDPKFNITLRPHPAMTFDLSNLTLNTNICIDNKRTLYDELDNHDVVVGAGSGALIESLIYGVPTIIYDNGDVMNSNPYFIDLNLSCLKVLRKPNDINLILSSINLNSIDTDINIVKKYYFNNSEGNFYFNNILNR